MRGKIVLVFLILNLAVFCSESDKSDTTTNHDSDTAFEEVYSDSVNDMSGEAEVTSELYDKSDDFSDIEGKFLHLQRYVVAVKTPFSDEPEKVISTSIILAIITKTGEGEYEVEEKLCKIYNKPGSITTTIIPDAYIKTYPVLKAKAKVNGNEFTEEKRVILDGVKLDNPETDELPTDKDDPRIFDQDKDGKPGLTVKITGVANGEVYIIERKVMSMEGKVENNNFIKGLISWSHDEVVIDASNPLLKYKAESTEVQDESWFQFRRIKKDVTCDDIVSYFINNEFNFNDYE